MWSPRRAIAATRISCCRPKVATKKFPAGEYVVGKVQSLTAEPQEHPDQFVIVLEVPDDAGVHDQLKKQAAERDAHRPAIVPGKTQ
jgi:hypothetical protein